MLLVYAADTDCLADFAVFEALYHTVQPYRQAKIDRLRFDRDKRLSLGAGVLLRKALTDAGCRYEEAEFAEDENGRPHLCGSRLQFSLSHTENRVLCAVSDRKVGCDAEAVGAFDRKIAERFFCPEETAQILSRTTDAERQDAFYRLWTLKESFSKAVGLGLLLPLNAFCVSLTDPPELRQTVSEEPFFLREFAPYHNIRQSICTQEQQNCCIFETTLI